MANLTSGQLAAKCAVNKETIRYYERMKLIPPGTKNASGYRIYPQEMSDRIRFIKRMQELGFTLNEIAKLLAIVDRNIAKCGDMNEFAGTKLKEVQDKIRDLLRIQNVLQDIQQCCSRQKETDLYQCRIMESLLQD